MSKLIVVLGISLFYLVGCSNEKGNYESGSADIGADKNQSNLGKIFSSALENLSNKENVFSQSEKGAPTNNTPPTPLSKSQEGITDTARTTNPSSETISFFGAEAKGNRFVFIIDQSGSMSAQSRFQRAKTELIRTLKSLPPNAQFMVYFFSNSFEKLPSSGDTMTAAVPEDIRMAESWINSRKVKGSTNPLGALTDGFRLQPDTIWLLTDGQFDREDQVLNLLRQLNPKAKVRINTVSMMNPSGEKVLKQIARQYGGSYRFVKF